VEGTLVFHVNTKLSKNIESTNSPQITVIIMVSFGDELHLPTIIKG